LAHPITWLRQEGAVVQIRKMTEGKAFKMGKRDA
jgi:hypothetical protein